MALTELFGSRKITFGAGGITGERIFKSLWGEATAAKPDIGDPFPGVPGLFVQSVEITPLGKSVTSSDAAEYAKITTRYSSLDSTQQQQTGIKIDESLEFGGEMLTKEGGRWKGDKGPAKPEEIGGIWYPRLGYTVTATVDTLSGTEIKKLLNATAKINSSNFLGAKPETWLFQGASARSFYDENGNKKYTLIYRFTYRPTGWNKPWHGSRDGGPKFEVVEFKKPGTNKFTERLYEKTNFNSLIGFAP